MTHRIAQTPPGPKAEKIVSLIRQHCIESTFTYPLVIANGNGCYIQDVDGNVFLDFTSNIGSCPLGYSHPDILEILQHYAKNGAYKIAGQDFYSEEHAELAKSVLSIAPKNFKAFFINSGAEAVENSIKLAYRARGTLPAVSCYGAFHGRTLGALTFTYSKPVQKKNFPELPVRRIKFCTSDDDPSIDDIAKVVCEDPNIAFIIAEAVQGEGGYRVASRKFMANLHGVAREHEIPLIIDEVQAGMGRTGEWWAFQHYGITPSIMSVAKALQVGAALFHERFDPREGGAVSSTWGGGHRIDMAVGARIIEVIKRERLLENARKMGSMLLKRVKELVGRNGLVEARGLGLMVGLEFETKERRNHVMHQAFRNGLLLLPAGEKAIRVAPPLVITEKQIDEGIEILSGSLAG